MQFEPMCQGSTVINSKIITEKLLFATCQDKRGPNPEVRI